MPKLPRTRPSTHAWLSPATCRKDFTREEAETFVMEALALAMGRDSSSGGCIRLVTLDASGAAHKTVRGDQVPLYQDDLPPPSYSMYGTTI
jgi:20S proteasome subunit beta 1